MKDLPSNIRQSLAERPDLSAVDAAKAADHHFDKDGRPKHTNETAKINNVDADTDVAETDEEVDQVNAVGRQRFKGNGAGSQRRFPSQQPRNFTPPFSNKPNYPPSKPRGNAAETNRPSTLKRICRFHLSYKDAAVSCEPGCQYRPSQQQSNTPAGNGQAGRRK